MADLDHTEKVAVIYLLWKARMRRTRYSPYDPEQRPSGTGSDHSLHPLQELRLDDGRFQSFLRVSRGQFEELLSRLGGTISLQDTNYKRSIPAAERLSICLRYLATGDSFRVVADSFRVGVSTVCNVVRQVATAIWDCLVEEFMPEPATEDWRSIAEEFRDRLNFPLCCGAVDGKTVQINNIRGTLSLVLLAVVDARKCFRVVDVGEYGKTGYGGVMAHSIFGQALQAGTLNLPPDQHLPGAEHRGPQPHVFVAGEAFPLRRNMLRPFPARGELSPSEQAFNDRLSRARLVVEDAFSMLVSQWRWYGRLNEVRTEVVQKCVKATCLLHNFLQASDEETVAVGPAAGPDASPAAGEGPLPGLGRVASNNSSPEARRVRDAFQDYFMAEGAISGQPQEE